jgi:hypothetical protein
MRTPVTIGRPPAGRRLAAVATAAIAALGLSTLTATPAFAADVTHTIAEVQGTGATSPLTGTVTVEGVVTGYYNAASGYRGLYLQSAGSGGATDATPGASDGIFVYFNQLNPSVAIGDLFLSPGFSGIRARNPAQQHPPSCTTASGAGAGTDIGGTTPRQCRKCRSPLTPVPRLLGEHGGGRPALLHFRQRRRGARARGHTPGAAGTPRRERRHERGGCFSLALVPAAP